MKLKVEYTVHVSPDDLGALRLYTGEPKLKRNDIRQTLWDIGEMGLEEQIFEGNRRIEAERQPDG